MSQPCPKITAALHDVMVKCAYVQKNGQNKFHNYRYAGEADLLAVLRPAMVEAGLLLLPSVTQAVGPDEYGNTTVRIEYTLAHKDGEVWPEKIVAMGCGNDKNSKGGIGDKGTYKAITGANKYLLFKLFQIETGDDPETDERDVTPPGRSTANDQRRGGDGQKPFDMGRFSADSWEAWANGYGQRINKAPTLKALNAFVQNNDVDMKGLQRELPERAAMLMTEVENRRHFFAQHPTGEVA